MFKWFGNKKISFQLLAGFAIVALLTAILGFLGIAAINNLVTTSNQMYSQATVTVMKTGEITEAFHLIAVNVRDMVTSDDIASIDARASDIKTLEATIDTLTSEIDPLITDPTTRASYLEFTAARASYAKTLTSAVNLAKTNADQTAILLIQGVLKEAADKELAALQTLAEKIKTNAAQSAADSQATGQASEVFMIIVIAVVFILSILIGIGISRLMSVPLKKSLTMIEALSMGHLDNRIRFDSKSEIGQMSRAMDGLADYLQNTVVKSMQRIAAGDVDISLTATDSEDQITPAIQTTVDSISLILAKTQGMLQSVADGNMRTRIETQEFQGEWLKLATGINQIVDEISAPISEASMVMSMMADGNLTIRMTGQYKGDHEDFVKTPLNKSLDNISSYVNEIAEILTAMSGSNLQQEIVNEYPGDFAPIKDALNLIIDTFNKVLSDMNVAADQVTAGARQVADGSQSLSQGSTTQAASIEQLTASLTDIASQTRQNAVNATQASELAIATRSNAIAGNDRMKEMQKAMEEINTSSTNISKIIKVIDDIAFQTNILALNAAVEAARAGQHGKGFAVVAEEVRNLAARSASAASETTGLIEGSIKKVTLGTRIADETASALDQIVNDVAKSATLVGEIAKASNEQASGIAQINQGIEQVSRVVQANSATAEESAAASEELNGQADMLKQMIGQFKLKKVSAAAQAHLSGGRADSLKSLAEAKAARKAMTRDEMVAEYQRKMTAIVMQKHAAKDQPAPHATEPAAAKPAARPEPEKATVKPAAKPAAKPTTKPAVKPVTKPAEKMAAAKPAATAKPATKPAPAKPAEKPEAKLAPAPETTAKPAVKPIKTVDAQKKPKIALSDNEFDKF